jgi:hypothetical protein
MWTIENIYVMEGTRFCLSQHIGLTRMYRKHLRICWMTRKKHESPKSFRIGKAYCVPRSLRHFSANVTLFIPTTGAWWSSKSFVNIVPLHSPCAPQKKKRCMNTYHVDTVSRGWNGRTSQGFHYNFCFCWDALYCALFSFNVGSFSQKIILHVNKLL